MRPSHSITDEEILEALIRLAEKHDKRLVEVLIPFVVQYVIHELVAVFRKGFGPSR